eukprot:XP_004918905.1 PREDICTED: transforming growth factor-beta receptor type 3-like protein isoform X1 [Xenopus tropicalis]
MHLLFYMGLCTGLVAAPPPWVSIEVPQALQLSETPHLAKSSVMCHHDKMAAIPQGAESPCKSHPGLEHSLRASVAKMQVRGPAVHCEREGVCSVSMGNRVQAEVSLASAPPYLGLFLSLCALSPSSDPFNHSQLPLLANGCPVKPDVSISLAPPTPCSTPMKNFSFRLGSFYNNSIQFLHCHVAICVQDPFLCRGINSDGGPNIPKCPTPDGMCSSFSPPLLKMKAHYVRTVTQPLIVTIPVASNSLLQPRAGKGQETLCSKKQVFAVLFAEFLISVGMQARRKHLPLLMQVSGINLVSFYNSLLPSINLIDKAFHSTYP